MRLRRWGVPWLAPGLLLVAFGIWLWNEWRHVPPGWLRPLEQLPIGYRAQATIAIMAGIAVILIGVVSLLMGNGATAAAIWWILIVVEAVVLALWGIHHFYADEWPGPLDPIPMPPGLVFLLAQALQIAIVVRVLALQRRQRKARTSAQ